MDGTIEERVIAVIKEELQTDTAVPPIVVTRDSALDELGVDSLENVELVMAMEEEFVIKISDVEANKIKTVGEMIDRIAALLQH